MSKSELSDSTIIDNIRIIGPGGVEKMPGREPATGYEALVDHAKGVDELWLHQVQAQDIGVKAGLMSLTETGTLKFHNKTMERVLKNLAPGLKWGISATERAQRLGGQHTMWMSMPAWYVRENDHETFVFDLFRTIFPHVEQWRQECHHAGDCCGHYYSNGLYQRYQGTRYLASVSYTQNV